MKTNPYQKYQENSVLTAKGSDLTLMLYNGAIKFCNQAIDAIEKKNFQETHNNIIKVENIIDELRITLDRSYAIAKEMDELYVYINSLLVKGNIKKDKALIEEAIYFIKEFRDAWVEAMKVKTNNISEPMKNII